MESPQNDIRRVVRELVETESSVDVSLSTSFLLSQSREEWGSGTNETVESKSYREEVKVFHWT